MASGFWELAIGNAFLKQWPQKVSYFASEMFLYLVPGRPSLAFGHPPTLCNLAYCVLRVHLTTYCASASEQSSSSEATSDSVTSAALALEIPEHSTLTGERPSPFRPLGGSHNSFSF